jgi:acyl carrier protein
MKNIKIITEILETNKSKLKPGSNLSNYVWDSMSQIKLITLLSDKNKKNINPQKLKNLKSVLDLDKFITDTIKK